MSCLHGKYSVTTQVKNAIHLKNKKAQNKPKNNLKKRTKKEKSNNKHYGEDVKVSTTQPSSIHA